LADKKAAKLRRRANREERGREKASRAGATPPKRSEAPKPKPVAVKDAGEDTRRDGG
jgi:hypothetical protein